MMRRSVILVFLIYLFACLKNEAQTLSGTALTSDSTPRYLALGDSYTIGTAIGSQMAYPQIFADSLRQNPNIDSLFVQVIAQNACTTAALQNGINAVKPDSNFNLVSILIGVNNQYRWRSIAERE